MNLPGNRVLSTNLEQSSEQPEWTEISDCPIEVPLDIQVLRQSAYQAEQKRLREPSLRKEVLLTPPIPERVGNFAAPLSPLRERDHLALAALFQRSDLYAIESDIAQMLLRLLPEPCWEDDPFEFLREFL